MSCLAEDVLNDFEHMPPINAKTVFRFTICIYCKKFWLLIEIFILYQDKWERGQKKIQVFSLRNSFLTTFASESTKQ